MATADDARRARQQQVEADEMVDESVFAWLDDTMSPTDREAFERELDGDPDRAREVKDIEAVVRQLRRLPAEEAPADFLRGVQHRIRRRTRGRHYGNRDLTRYRFPYEAVINGILLGLLMAIYIISMPTPDDTPVPVAPAVAEGMAASNQVIETLAPYGTVAIEPSTAPGEVALRVMVPNTQVDIVKRALADLPSVTRVDVTPALDGRSTFRVGVRAGGPAP